jgi:hypothetical protein
MVENDPVVMPVHQLESVAIPETTAGRPPAAPRTAGLPDPQDIPLHVRNMAVLRGLGYTFRQIGQNYGVTPQAASVMLARQKALLQSTRRACELSGLSPRAVNCLGRLGIRTREEARRHGNLGALLENQRNCGEKTIREILDWAG